MPRSQYSERTGAEAIERPLLIWEREGHKQSEFVLWPERPATIGRDATSTVSIDSPYVSKNHAALAYRGGSWILEDLGSANGTLVNGNPIRVHFGLRPGDRIEIGDNVLVFADGGREKAGSGQSQGSRFLRLAFVAVAFGGVLVFILLQLTRSTTPASDTPKPNAANPPETSTETSATPHFVDTALINQVLDRARRTGVAQADALLDEGMLDFNSGRYRDAAQLLTASLARKPDDVRTKSRLVDAQRMLERSIGEASAEAGLAETQLRDEDQRLALERILALTYPGDARYAQAEEKLKKLTGKLRKRPDQ